MKTLIKKEEMKLIKKGLPIGAKYFKAQINPYYLRSEISTTEIWGYINTDDIEEAKKIFMKEVDEQLDILDYGFMELICYEKVAEENNPILVNGMYCTAHKVFKKVNNFGRWLDENAFLKEIGLK